MIRKIIKYTAITLIILITVGYATRKVYEYHQVALFAVKSTVLALTEPLKMDCIEGEGVAIGRISGTKHPMTRDSGAPVSCYKEGDKSDSDDSDDSDDTPTPPTKHTPPVQHGSDDSVTL